MAGGIVEPSLEKVTVEVGLDPPRVNLLKSKWSLAPLIIYIIILTYLLVTEDLMGNEVWKKHDRSIYFITTRIAGGKVIRLGVSFQNTFPHI